jgi:hypothetical protein
LKLFDLEKSLAEKFNVKANHTVAKKALSNLSELFLCIGKLLAN